MSSLSAMESMLLMRRSASEPFNHISDGGGSELRIDRVCHGYHHLTYVERYSGFMAGRNQHYIPQLLQRGFSAKVTRSGRHQVMVFRKGRAPHLAGTANTFVSRDFYGRPDVSSLDGTITDLEGSLTSFMEKVRAISGRTWLGQSTQAAALIHLLSIRIRWIRQFAGEAASVAIEHVVAQAATPEGKVQLLIDQCRKEPNYLADELERNVSKKLGRAIGRNERRKLRAATHHLLANPARMAELLGNSSALPFAQLRSSLPEIMAQAHSGALSRVLAEKQTQFRDYLASLDWEVVPTSERLVLGDCGPLYFDLTGQAIGPLGGGRREESAGLLLPVASGCLLVGVSKPQAVNPGVGEINAALAGWSHEAFIAATCDDELRGLHASLGWLLTGHVRSQAEEFLLEPLPQ